MTTDTIVAIVIVLAAMGGVGYGFYRVMSGEKSGCGCDDCCNDPPSRDLPGKIGCCSHDCSCGSQYEKDGK